ncbi:heme exporter protein CcmD [Phenylobacterium sp. J426]|nr:heme exporter protein CcmD [Phenylobacterium sp. J426]MCR5873770.1 heme exporter protein CcmD [Phenylobacterium sp. J426]
MPETLPDYGAYIWPAFIITGATFALLIWMSLAHARRWKRRFEERTRK